MSEQEQWQHNNDAYLGAAVEWLRLRLEGLAARNPLPEKPVRRRGLLGWLLGDVEDRVALPPVKAPGEKELAKARAAMDESAKADPPPAALLLQQRLGLSEFELEILLLCAALELDTGIAGLCARAHNDSSKPYPTYALALALLPSAEWGALSPERPLRFWKLIDVSQVAGAGVTASALRADERILNCLKGLNHLDERLSMYLTLLSAPGRKPALQMANSHQAIADNLAEGLSAGRIPEAIHLLGADSASKQAIACETAAQLSMAVYTLPAAMLPGSPAEGELLARTWRRECLLLPVALYLDAKEAERDYPPVARFLARSSGLVFLDTRDSWRNLSREAVSVDVEKPLRAEQRAEWAALLGDAALAGILASQFNLSLPDVRRAAAPSAPAAKVTGRPVEERVWSACKAASRPKLDILAQRLDAKATWEDLVLPVQETSSLREIATHARRRALVYDDWGFSSRMNRGLGLSALFSGESGTGKTMAAEVIANELKLNLYRIDLSAVVSKYIGETEKNLRQVFDAAEDGGAILFFDEADALFGKRSEVKDSHDRYANIEINYLLQRMEAYSGLAILATNLKNSLDTAFLRRLRFIVQFPFPAQAERKRIWQRAFPDALPREALDFDFLARLNVAGGTVQNIALRAAFLAAGDNEQVSMEIVLDAARAEFRKLERPVNEADFRWQGKRAEAVA